MKNFFQILLICGLIPALSIPVSAAADPGKSEEGQAMIGPSRSDSGSSSGIAADPGKSEEGQAMIGPSRSDSGSSSGMDWGAANNAASPAAGDGDFTVVIDPGHQGPSVDMSAPEPMAPGSDQTKPKATSGTQGAQTRPNQKQPPAHRETSPESRNMN